MAVLRLRYFTTLVSLASEDQYTFILQTLLLAVTFHQGRKRSVALYKHASVERHVQLTTKMLNSCGLVRASSIREQDEGYSLALKVLQRSSSVS